MPPSIPSPFLTFSHFLFQIIGQPKVSFVVSFLLPFLSLFPVPHFQSTLSPLGLFPPNKSTPFQRNWPIPSKSPNPFPPKKMSALSHSTSVAKLSEIESRPAHSLFRSTSLYDVNKYSLSVDRFTPARSFLVHNDSRPLWDHTFYRDVVGSQQPRFYRPAYLMDTYWWDKYYYFSPIYKGTQPYKRHYASQHVTYPCSWNNPHVYWARYRGYWYDSEDDYAPLYRRCFEPYFNDSAYQQRFFNRYKSHILNNDVYG